MRTTSTRPCSSDPGRGTSGTRTSSARSGAVWVQGSPDKNGSEGGDVDCLRAAEGRSPVVSRERIGALVAALAAVGMLRIAWLHFVSEPVHEPRRTRIDARYAPLLPFLRAGEIGY